MTYIKRKVIHWLCSVEKCTYTIMCTAGKTIHTSIYRLWLYLVKCFHKKRIAIIIKSSFLYFHIISLVFVHIIRTLTRVTPQLTSPHIVRSNIGLLRFLVFFTVSRWRSILWCLYYKVTTKNFYHFNTISTENNTFLITS